jgi:ferredoxin
MKAKVDKVKCISCGLCLQTCPDVFEWGDDNLAQVKVDVVPKESEESARDAAESCPTDAITIEE